MEGIRIVQLPPSRMVASGDSDLETFDAWWTEADKKRKDQFFPRDFMWFDEASQKLVWGYVLPYDMSDTGRYGIIDFPGGLYAAAVSRDGDDEDGERVYTAIREWTRDSGAFALDEGSGRHTMFHVITPDEAFRAMGFRQLDIYVPTRVV